MKIKLIPYIEDLQKPVRAHDNDVGADVFSPYTGTIGVNHTYSIPLGFGIEVPIGYGAFVFPRSSQSNKGITVQLPPVDPGYTGQLHAIITNTSIEAYHINKGDRIGQLVVLPIAIADFITEDSIPRNDGCFGSTGQ